MKEILRTVWQKDKRGFLLILLLNIGVALMGSVSIVMLVPMLDLLNVSVGQGSALEALLAPFRGMTFNQRAVAVITVFAALMLLRSMLNAYVTVRMNAFLERYEMNLRQDVYDAIGVASWENLCSRPATDLIHMITVQCRQVRACLQLTISMIISCFSALLQLAIACWMSLPITVLILIVGGGFLLLFRPFLKKSREYGQKAVEVNRNLHREIQNQLGGVKEIRSYGVEEHHRELFEDISRECYDTNLRNTQLRVLPQLAYGIGAIALIVLAFVYSVMILKAGTAQLVILVYVFSRLWPMFSSWQGQMQSIQTCLPAYQAIRTGIEELTSGIREPQSKTGDLPLVQEVAFSQVGFTYRDGNEEVLHDVSFTLPKGTVTALVGPSGAGKSTTADLLMGLLQPTCGQILVDGVALTAQNLGMWRKAIGYIPQEPLIFNTTVRENLLRFHPQATEAEMVQALKRSLAWPFVEKLPNGLDTDLGDKGVRISGGERQRIVLARVLLGSPRLIILDEATSALDYESEQFIRETIRSLGKNTTVLIIAHRMTTVRGADRAVVLLDGTVAEQGSLQELLQKEDGYIAGMIGSEE